MKRTLIVSLSLISVLLTAAETAPKVFDFENGDIRSGEIAGTVKDAACKPVAAVFENGPHGKALALDRQGFHCPVKGLVTQQCGAVSFRFKPVNWPRGEENFLPVFAVDTGKGHGWKMLAYYYYRPAKEVSAFITVQLFSRDKKVLTVIQMPTYKNLKFDDWNDLVISWDASSVSLCFNGKQFVRKELPKDFVMMPAHPNDCLVIMPALFWSKKSQVKTLVDDVTVFPEALDKEAASAVFSAGGNE